MPYTWINGGRSASYEAARQASINSIPLFLIGILIALIASGIIRMRWNAVLKIIILIWLWFGVLFSSLGCIFQLLGTPFEKLVMSLVCATSVIAGIRLATEKR